VSLKIENVGLKGSFKFLETLVNLHDSDISHRDIKPDNLYLLDGNWVLADFGIASFPGKEAITEAGRKLGPMFYIAPEMLNSRSVRGFC
jgi:serine/threonine protein kinase